MLSRLAAGLCAATLAALIGAPSPTLAQDKTFELKLSHWVPPSHPLQKALEEWGASVEKDSGGTIKYKVYPAQQLGKAFDHYEHGARRHRRPYLYPGRFSENLRGGGWRGFCRPGNIRWRGLARRRLFSGW